MKIRNETSLDYKQLHDVVINTKRHKIIFALIICEVVLLSCFIISDYIEFGEINWGTTGIALFLLFYLIWHPIKTRSLYKDYCGNANFSVKYIFRDEDFTSTSSTGKVTDATGTYRYEVISKMVFRRDYILLFLSKLEVFPIDKRNFSSEDEMNELIAVLKAKIKK